MSKAFLDRRDKLIARHKVLESVKGSGYHDDDKFEGKLCAPQSIHLPGGPKVGQPPLPRISDHVVAFYADRTVAFVGADVVKVQDAFKSWLDRHAPTNPAQIADLTGTDKKLLVEIPKVAATENEGVATLVLWRDVFNDFVTALYAEGVGLSGLSAADTSTDPF
jgi:hypothetical protein